VPLVVELDLREPSAISLKSTPTADKSCLVWLSMCTELFWAIWLSPWPSPSVIEKVGIQFL